MNLKALRPIVAVGLWLALATASAQVPQRLLAHQAATHRGEQAQVCDVVAGARNARSTRGSPTYLNFDKPYPHNPFTAIVWGRDRRGFPAKPEALLLHKACVTGEIENYKGKPQIVLRRPEQVIFWPIEDAPARED